MANNYVDIGHLNNKLIVKSVNPTTDSGGGATEGTPTTVTTIWCNIKPMTGNRALEFAQITNGKPYEIVINYPIGDFTIDETNILTFDSRILTVHSVVQIDESLKQYKIIAYEKV